jgi:hypothetical protein
MPSPLLRAPNIVVWPLSSGSSRRNRGISGILKLVNKRIK